jgi:hypothetical protein
LPGQIGVFSRVDHVNSTTEYTHGASTGPEGAFVRRRVYAAGEPADHDQSGPGQVMAEAAGYGPTGRRGPAGPDHGDGSSVEDSGLATHPENDRGVHYVRQQAGIPGIARHGDADPSGDSPPDRVGGTQSSLG